MSAISSRKNIDEFLRQQRFAMIGVSRDPRDFSRTVFRAFLERGYEVVPIHPEATEMEGRQCASSIGAIQPPVEGVLFLTPPRVTASLIRDCAATGVKRVWMFRATGAGAVSPDAIAFCAEQGIDVVPGECPLMFLPNTGWVHRLHRFVLQCMPARSPHALSNIRQ
jgi:predicted CoA-binding protein